MYIFGLVETLPPPLGIFHWSDLYSSWQNREIIVVPFKKYRIDLNIENENFIISLKNSKVGGEDGTSNSNLYKSLELSFDAFS